MKYIDVEKRATLQGHKDSIYALGGSQFNNIFFSAGADGMLAKWDLKSPTNGDLIAQVPNSIYAIHYDIENEVLITGQNNEGIQLIDWQKKEEKGSLKFTDQFIFFINSIGTSIVAGTGDGQLVFIDIETLAVINRLQLSKKSARCMTISEDLGHIAIGFSDNIIRVLDLRTLEIIQSWDAHDKSVFGLRYNEDSSQLISVSRDAKIKAWQTHQTQKQYTELETVNAHLYAINDIDFSPDGKHFVTCSMDKTLKIWRSEDLNLLKVIDKDRHQGHLNSVNKVLWSTFENQIISCSDDRTISVWDLHFK